MKRYSYRARAADGGTASGEIEAADRTAALEGIRRRGLVPVSVEEGGLPSQAGGSLSRFKVPALACLAAILAVAAGLWLSGGRKAPAKAVKAPAEKERAKRPEPSAKPEGRRAAARPAVPAPAQKPAAAQPGRAPVAAAAGERPRDTARRVDQERAAVTNAVPLPPTFKLAIEGMMGAVVSTKPGDMPPPLPPVTKNIENQFYESLTNNIVVQETDSPEMEKRKEDAALFKQQMAELVKQGYTPGQILDAVQAERRDQHALKKAYHDEYKKLLEDGRDEEAAGYLEEANAVLKEKGIAPLSAPKPRPGE